MTKKKATPIIHENTPDYLIKSKKQFELDLSERICIGEELLSRKITTQQELSKLSSDYNSWHDFNTEFISRAFNKTNSQYFQDYTQTSSFSYSSMIYTPSFGEQVQETFGDISNYVLELQKIKEKLILIEELPGLQKTPEVNDIDKQTEGLKYLNKLFPKFHRTAQSLRHRHSKRDTLMINDEYDVQDLLRALLQIHFDDVREEDYTPSYAGGNSRVDFVLKDEMIVVETKMTNDNLKDKDVGSQLLIDIGRYRSHPDCKVLVVFVYDKGDHVRNKAGMITDLERMSSNSLEVKVFIEPK